MIKNGWSGADRSIKTFNHLNDNTLTRSIRLKQAPRSVLGYFVSRAKLVYYVLILSEYNTHGREDLEEVHILDLEEVHIFRKVRS